MIKLIGNVLVTEELVRDYEHLKTLVRIHKSVYCERHRTIYSASTIMNWQYSIVNRYLENKELYVTINLRITGILKQIKNRLK